jgi:hypothetical protein
MKEDCMMMLSTSIMKKKNQEQIQLRLSTIFKQKVIDTPQTFGSFYDANGEKYCAVSVLSKYLGYDIAAVVVSNKVQNLRNANPAELIPSAILERIDNFSLYQGNAKRDLRCFCSRPTYYYCYSLISLLIHLNDHHKMTFTEIGNWLESIDM